MICSQRTPRSWTIALIIAFTCPSGHAAIFEVNPQIDTFLSSPLLGSNVGDGVRSCCGNPVPAGELISNHSTLEVDTNQGGGGPVEPLMQFDLSNEFTEFGPESVEQLFIDDPNATATLRLAVVNGFGPLDVRRITVDWLSDPATGGNQVQRANFPGVPADSMMSAFVDGVNIESQSFTNPVPAIPLADQLGFVEFDVTTDIRAWTSGASPNYGWAFLPSDSNGGIIIATENDDLPPQFLATVDATASDLPALRPTLVLDIFVPSPLALLIDARTGETILRGANANPVEFISYEVRSNSEALLVGSFSSLESQGVDALDGPVDADNIAGNSPGETWEVISSSSSSVLEGFLFGSTMLGLDEELSLGNLYDVSQRGGDTVTLEFALASGQQFSVNAEFFMPPTVTGDFNGNGTVDGSDFLLWQQQAGLSGPMLAADANGDETVDTLDLDVWRTALGATAASTAVPEPCTLLAACIISSCLCTQRTRC